MDDLAADGRTDFRHSVRVLVRRKYVVIPTVVAVLAIALAYSLLRAPTYSATATVLLPQNPASADLNVSNSQLQQSGALQRDLADQQQFAEGDAVRAEARGALGFPAKIAVGTSSTADVLSFTSSSGSSRSAAEIANAFAKAYIQASRASQIDQYTQQVAGLQASIAHLQAEEKNLSPANPQLAGLAQSINTLTQTVEQTQAASEISSQVGPTIVSAAKAPKSPATPKKTMNILLGLLAGAILGIGFAFLAERLDDGINSRESAEAVSGGVPLIALVPNVDSWRRQESRHLALIEEPNSTVAESYRTFRTSVQFLGIDDPNKVIGVTSSVADEGKSTAVANLAVSFAKAGQRVIVVSCDLRKPSLHKFFEVDNEIGLTSVLLGNVSLKEALRSAEQTSRLQVLPSGPIPPNPAEILSTDRVRYIVDELAAMADIVLLDCPPVLPVTDALLLSRLMDGMLVLASVKTTSVHQLRRSLELLHQVNAPVIGLVLNRVPSAGRFSYGYAYHYGHEYAEGRMSPARDSRVSEQGVRSPHGVAVPSDRYVLQGTEEELG